MFAGHLAAGLVLKKMERRINLGWLFFALLELEQIHPEGYAQTHYLTFTFPYSHGLATSVVGSLSPKCPC